MDSTMRILILGAGAIGCYYGARLQQAGHNLTYIARGHHLNAMQKNGLIVKHENFDFNEEVIAISLQELKRNFNCPEFDLIIVCLKSIATGAVLTEIRDWLTQGSGLILSLQNGVENESLIATAVGQKRTLGGLAVRIGGHIYAPGVVRVQGAAQIVFGVWPNTIENPINTSAVQLWCKILKAASIDAKLSPDIERELWLKLLINNGVNPLSAVTGLDTRALTSNPVLGRAVYTIMQETAMAASCDGIEINKQDIDKMFMLISNFDAIKTSTLIDFDKGRELEIDSISGSVLRRCRKHYISAPMTEFVDTLLRIKIYDRNLKPY